MSGRRSSRNTNADEDGEEGEGYFASVSDLMVGVLFVFLLMLTVFALNFQDAEQAQTVERQKYEQALRDLEQQRQRTIEQEALARAAQAEAERQSAENGELRDLLRRAMTQITHDIEDREAARLRLLASLQRSLHERHIEVTLVSVWELRESLESVSGGGLNPLKFLDSLSGIDSRGAPCGMTRTGNGTIGTSCATPAT